MAIANLLVKIGADISELVSGVNKATSVVDKIGKQIDGAGKDIQKGLIAAFSLGALKSFASDLLETADSIVKTADRTGLLISEVQKLDYIASQSGNSMEELTSAVGQLQNRLASGDKSALGAVKQLGLSFDQLKNASPFEQLQLVAEAIAKVENPAQRAQIAMDLFGKSGIAIIPTLISNFRKLGDEAPVMADNTTRALDTAGDTFNRFQKQLKVWVAESYNFLSRLFDRGVILIQKFIAGAYSGTAKLLELAGKIPGASKVFGDFSGTVKGLQESSQFFTDAAKSMEYQLDHTSGSAEKSTRVMAPLVVANKEAKKAVDEHAKSIAKLTEELSGAGAIKAANDMLEALRKMPPVQNLTADAQKQINKVMGEALDVFNALGVEPPKNIRAVYQATFQLTDTLPLIKRWKESFSDVVQDGFLPLKSIADKMAHETWPSSIAGIDGLVRAIANARQATKTFGDVLKDNLLKSLEQIPQIVVNAFTGGGGIAGAIKASASALGAAVGGTIGTAIGGPIGGAIGSALGSLTGPLIGGIGKLLGIGATEYEKRMKAAAQETKSLQDQLVASHGSMAQLIQDADLVGINIKAAFDWKDPEAFKKVVEDLNDKTNLLNDAMKEYGFTWEDLGDKARNAKLSQLFDELKAKTDILRTAGIDYHEILTRQADDYSKLVQSAIRTGTEIPIAMQPVLQDLVDMGLLVDENGQAFKDLSQVTWAKTLTQGFDEVTKAIYDLRDALTQGVGGALDQLATRRVKIPIEFDVQNAPGGEVPEFATGTRGQYHDFGAGQYVKLHGRERVSTEQEDMGFTGGDIYVSIGNRAIDPYLVEVARKDAALGGIVPRTSARRRY